MTNGTAKTVTAERAGFTLLELVLVITILSILFGIVFVGMNGATDSEKLASSARGLCAFVTDARNTAICGQKRLYLVYQPEQNAISVCSSLGTEPSTNPGTSPVAGPDGTSPSLKSFKLADGVTISGITIGTSTWTSTSTSIGSSGTSLVIEISSQGDIQQHSVSLKNKSGSMTVKVDGVLGTVRVEE